jgi:hypothetical protein
LLARAGQSSLSLAISFRLCQLLSLSHLPVFVVRVMACFFSLSLALTVLVKK